MSDINWIGKFWNTSHADYHGTRIPLNSASDVQAFFRSINRGAFVRLLSDAKQNNSEDQLYGSHSIFFDGINSDGTGFYAYECNLDGNNGVHYQEYTFSQFFGEDAYVEVVYYVDHTLSSQKTPYSLAYHKEECVNCDGYLLQSHTGSTTYAHHDVNQHKATISCCGYVYYEAHTFNTGSRCTKCGYLRGSSINKLDPELETG